MLTEPLRGGGLRYFRSAPQKAKAFIQKKKFFGCVRCTRFPVKLGVSNPQEGEMAACGRDFLDITRAQEGQEALRWPQ